MTEYLNENEKAYDLGYNDFIEGNLKISYEDWCSVSSSVILSVGFIFILSNQFQN